MSKISSFLDKLVQDQKNLVDFSATIKQRQCVRGEIDFKNGVTTFIPTVADSYQLVNDDPNNRLPEGMGAKADSLHYALDECLAEIWMEQTRLGLKHNTGTEIYRAANSGNYSTIRGA